MAVQSLCFLYFLVLLILHYIVLVSNMCVSLFGNGSSAILMVVRKYFVVSERFGVKNVLLNFGMFRNQGVSNESWNLELVKN